MQIKNCLTRMIVAALPLLAACSDRSPTVSGDEFFPGGARPVTLQTSLSGANRFTEIGRFANFPAAVQGELIVANAFGGSLQAHALVRFTGYPSSVDFKENDVAKHDSVFAYRSAAVVVQIDSSASSAPGPVAFKLWSLGQRWEASSVSWDTAVANDSITVLWRERGGTKDQLLSQVTWTQSDAGDSIQFPLDSLQINAIARDTAFRGFLVTAETPGSRTALAGLALRATIHPASASADTINVVLNLTSGPRAFIFTPDPPRAETAYEVGGVRAARTLFRLNLDAKVPRCAAGCDSVSLKDVSLNEVAIVFRTVPVPGGFGILDSIPIRIRKVQEPELGRFAPLLESIGDRIFINGTPAERVAWVHPRDTIVTVPITQFAFGALRGDSLSGSFALLSEPPGARFGVVWFDPHPRLRVTYTLLPRPTLP